MVVERGSVLCTLNLSRCYVDQMAADHVALVTCTTLTSLDISESSNSLGTAIRQLALDRCAGLSS